VLARCLHARLANRWPIRAERRVSTAAGEEDEEETATPAPYHLVLQAYMQQQGGAVAQQQPAGAAGATPGASGAATPAHPASLPSGGASPLRTPAEEVIVYRPQPQQHQALQWSFMPISPYADHELALSPLPSPPPPPASGAARAAPRREPSLADLQQGQRQQALPLAGGGLAQAAAAPAASPTLSELGFRSAPISSSTSPVPFCLDDGQPAPGQHGPAAAPSPAASGSSGSVSRSLSLTTLPSEAVAAQRVPYSDWQAAQAAEEPALADTAGSGGVASQQQAASTGRFSLSTLPSEAARAQRVAYSEWQQQQLRGVATPVALADTAASRAAQGQAASSGGSVLDLSPLAQPSSAATPDCRSLSMVGSEVAAANRIGFEEWQQQVRDTLQGLQQCSRRWALASLRVGPCRPQCADFRGRGASQGRSGSLLAPTLADVTNRSASNPLYEGTPITYSAAPAGKVRGLCRAGVLPVLLQLVC
jgi:hypothetical protein